MEDNLKALNIKLIFKSMKTLLFIIPIIIISNNIYTAEFGVYQIHWDVEYMLNYFSHETNKFVFALFTFTFLFFSCIGLSGWIIPSIMTFFVKRKIKNKTIIHKSNERIEKILNRSIGFNPYNNPDSDAEIVSEFKAYSMISYPFMTAILWLLVWNVLFAYILMAIVSVVFYLMVVSFKSVLK